ncbi:replication fork protection component Swi3-domain-containing protein [Mycena sanguinolenta]|nr:replication fork protection component Swi3-domain-containing protein [Mycena sanguinolenta]
MTTLREVPLAENLFLSDDDDEKMADAPPRRVPDTPPQRAELQPDVVAAFAAVDTIADTPEDGTGAPALTPHQVLSSSPAHHIDDAGEKGDGKTGKDVKKPKKKVMRLNEGRLIECFPQLIEDTKNIKIKGKGHEASDLNRLLQVYQFWTHRLYPKTTFKDTVDRVEKLCHSKHMHSRLSGWRDEARGVADEGEDQDRGLVDLTDDSIPAADSDQADYASSSSHEATRPPSSVDGDARASSVDHDFNDDPDLVAAMDAAGKLNSRQRFMGGSTSRSTVEDESWAAEAELEAAKESQSQVVPDDEDELWSMVDTDTMNTAATATVPQQRDPEEDDEGWAAMDAMNEEVTAKTVPVVSVPQHAPSDDFDEDWDALDAMAVDGS